MAWLVLLVSGVLETVWVGIGAVGTVLYGMATLGESVTVLRVLCLGCVVGGVVGLKFLH